MLETVALFGPTGVGKTDVALALAQLLRRYHGEDPVAVSCDAIQLYEGLEVLSGAPSPEQRARLEHRLVGIASIREQFSAGRFAELAQLQIDSLLELGRRPIVVGGTGLYLRAALSDLELRPPVDPAIRAGVERDLAALGSPALHSQIAPARAAAIHPNDRKRVARTLELQRAGIEPAPTHEQGGRLWTAELRHPTVLVGLTMSPAELDARIERRVDAMLEAGAVEEAVRASHAGASRTARAALGFDNLLAGNAAGVKAAHRAYARRQLTWMRKMSGVHVIDRGGRDEGGVAFEILGLLGR